MSAALKLPKTSMTDAEWQTRCELAALYHVVNLLGWTDLINTHMSARIPDEPNTFLINNYGEMFDEITASSLLKMDMDGKVYGEGGRFNNAGFTIHSGVYKARLDAMCVMHTHTRAGAGVSMLQNGLRPISQDAMQVYDDIAYHDYGVPASAEECEALGRSCRQGTLFRMYCLERACELELIARTLGSPPVQIDDHVVGKSAERMRKRRNTPEYGLAEWQGLVRTVDRRGVDYRC